MYGLKPSFGRIPIASRPDAFANHSPTCSAGPITRTVEDAALMLDVMAGPHPRDPFSLPNDARNFLDAVDRDIDDLRIGYCHNLGVFPVARAVKSVLDDAVAALDDAIDSLVESVDVDLGLSHEQILETMYTGWSAVGHALHNEHVLKEYGVDLYGEHREELSEYSIETIEAGRDYDAVEYKLVDVPRTTVLDGLQDTFDDYDVILSATVGIDGFEKCIDRPTQIDGEPIPDGGWHLTLPYNFSGHPAASIPVGVTDSGLPVGLQIAGRRFADDNVLSVSAAVEHVTNGRVDLPYQRSSDSSH